MKLVQRQILIACLALLCGGAVLAADAPKADAKKEEKKDDKKEEKKDDKKDDHAKDGKDAKDGKAAKTEPPPEPDLPSRPYPTNASPKAFAPKGEPKKDVAAAAAAAEKPAEKGADAHGDKHGDKPADKHGDKHADKPADKHGDKTADKHEPAHNKPATKKKMAKAAPVKPVTDPVLAQVARESLHGNAAAGGYKVQSGDNLDRVIRKTMPNSPFSMEVMREAFGRANPQLLANVKDMKLKPGSTLNLPNAAVMRSVVLGDPAPQVEPMRVRAPGELHAKAPVVNPTIAPTANDLNPPIAIPRQAVNVAASANPAPEVSPEEKKKWVRFP